MANTDFQPIPGVTYEGLRTNKSVAWATFVPRWENDHLPWLETAPTASRFTGDDFEPRQVSYNPHPPTRTEWAWKYQINPTILVTGEDEAAARRQSAQESGRVLRRQVTEWQEVDQ